MQKSDASPFKRIYPVWIVLAAAALIAGGYFFFDGGLGMEPPGPRERVTMAHTANTDAILAVTAKRRGYYHEEGLEAAYRLHGVGKLALQDVLEGKADFATVAETPFMFAVMRGEKISVIATILKSNIIDVIVARRDRGIGAVGDLRGRKVGTTLGTRAHYFLDAILGVHGIAWEEVRIVDLKAEEIPETLERGDVDAVATFDAFSALAQKKLGGNGITFHGSDIYTATFNVVAKQEFIRQNPTKVKKMLQALLKAEAYVSRHPAEAQKILAESSGLDIATIRDSWDKQDFRVSLDQFLLLALEDESKWAIRNRLTDSMEIPNYLDYVYLDGLASVKPKALNILR